MNYLALTFLILTVLVSGCADMIGEEVDDRAEDDWQNFEEDEEETQEEDVSMENEEFVEGGFGVIEGYF